MAGICAIAKARQSGARLGRASRAAAERRRRVEPADHLRKRQVADAQQVFDAIWQEDRVNIANLAIGRASYGELRAWAEHRWHRSPQHQSIFQSADQFARFVEHMARHAGTPRGLRIYDAR